MVRSKYKTPGKVGQQSYEMVKSITDQKLTKSGGGIGRRGGVLNVGIDIIPNPEKG